MQDHLREYAAHLDERAEQIRDDLYWWEKMGLRIRGRKGDVPLVDETEGFLTRERENLEKYESLREAAHGLQGLGTPSIQPQAASRR